MSWKVFNVNTRGVAGLYGNTKSEAKRLDPVSCCCHYMETKVGDRSGVSLPKGWNRQGWDNLGGEQLW
jgi:hypothetical protein